MLKIKHTNTTKNHHILLTTPQLTQVGGQGLVLSGRLHVEGGVPGDDDLIALLHDDGPVPVIGAHGSEHDPVLTSERNQDGSQEQTGHPGRPTRRPRSAQ